MADTKLPPLNAPSFQPFTVDEILAQVERIARECAHAYHFPERPAEDEPRK